MAKFSDSALLKFNMGFIYYVRAVNGWSQDPQDDLRKVVKLARQGMASDNLSPLERKLGRWLLAYANLVERDFKSAMREAEAAIALAPNDAFMRAVLSDAAIGAGDTGPRQQRVLFVSAGMGFNVRGTVSRIARGDEATGRYIRRHPARQDDQRRKSRKPL
ncbi:hypothetical protein [Sinorhizobium terangae]|uniref:hypothetical protein n=1 Tax=Sinorhizobium terangae TaxID=110322 RepID=UPI0024B1E043|nr:hypothetical protein [Sinorhizobium terangae]WFU50775.1 hypothetical protein QA637_19315 [Sinorhizobium terangae]